MRFLFYIILCLASPTFANNTITLDGKLTYYTKKFLHISPFAECSKNEGFYLEKYKSYAPVNSPHYKILNRQNANATLQVKYDTDKAIMYRTLENGACVEKGTESIIPKDESYYQTTIKLRGYDIWPNSHSEKDIRELPIPNDSRHGEILPFMKSRWTRHMLKLTIRYPNGSLPDADNFTLKTHHIHINFK
jgi:hypothetical protein